MVRTRPVEPVPCPWTREGPPRWGTAISAWGDTLVCAGNALALAERHGALPIGMVYYGWYPQIAAFLREQPWVRECVHVVPTDEREFWQVLWQSSGGLPRADWLPLMLRGTGIDPETVCPTQFNMALASPQPLHLWRPRLPARAWREAQALLADLPPDTYLLHPWSFQSAQLQHHWPHWPALVRRLLAETPHTYLLTGQGIDPRPFGRHPRLGIRVNRIPRMDTVLALTSRSAGLIGTCNSLACWCAAVGKRALVVPNSGIQDSCNLFGRWIRQPSVTWCEYGEPLETVWKRIVPFVATGGEGQ